MFRTFLLTLLLTACIPWTLAQSDAHLKDYFEGRHVIVKLDMPGDKSGVDLRLEETRQLDYGELGQRLKRYGVSIRRGDRVMVTFVKVNKRNIEFQLAGGGYGTFGDPSTSPSINTHVSKSSREKSLEEDIKKEADPNKKKRLKTELDHLKTERQREEARLEAEAAQAQILAEAREREVRSDSGSRFNLWFAEAVPREALTPEAVKAALADYLEFDVDKAERDPGGPNHAPPSALVLKKGLTEQEVTRAHGKPAHRETERIKELTVVTSTYDLPDGELQAVFVEGVLVRYSMISK